MGLKERDYIKIQAIINRLGYYNPNKILCDYCQKRIGVDYHERIARSKTVGNPEARKASFQEELCNLLCRECHERADDKDVAEALWRFSIRLYGIDQVKNAMDNLNSVMKVKLVIPSLR